MMLRSSYQLVWRSAFRMALFGVALLNLSAARNDLAAQKVQPCDLITKAEAAQILANPSIAKAQSIPSGDDSCGFLGAPFDVHTEVLGSPASWSAAAKKMVQQKKAEAIDKIGEEAYFTIDGNGDYVMTSRKGDRMVTVTMFKDQSTLAEARPKLV